MTLPTDDQKIQTTALERLTKLRNHLRSLDSASGEAADLTLALAVIEASQKLSAMYSHAWDVVDGELMMFATSIPRFEEAHGETSAALDALTKVKP